MSASVCPSCGASLAALEPFRLGKLFVDKGGAVLWWGEHPVPLTASERLLVIAVARADGIPISRPVLAEIVGSDEAANPENIIAVFLTRINAKFRAIDPHFDSIENVRGTGLRWRFT